MQLGTIKASSCKVNVTEMGIDEDSCIEFGILEVSPLEVDSSEVSFPEIRLNIWLVLSPSVPCLYSLLEDVKVE
jgi:hypothetical protein